MKAEFTVYSTKDYAVVSHLQYPRCIAVFHETPQKYASGRLKHSWTHNRKVICKLTQREPAYRVKQYATECIRTFRAIPDYEILSASQYAKVIGVSHVTAKKKLLKLCREGKAIQISQKYFAIVNGEVSKHFIIKIKLIYDSQEKNQSNLCLPQILRRLQALKEYSLTHNHAYYKNVAKILSQPLLSWLISRGLVKRLQLDFLQSRASVVYLCFSL